MVETRGGRAIALMACLFVVAACEEVTGPDFRDGSIEVSLSLSQSVVVGSGTVVAELRYENFGPTPASVFAGGCLAFASVYSGELRIPFPSTQYACIAMGIRHDLEPGRALRCSGPSRWGTGVCPWLGGPIDSSRI